MKNIRRIPLSSAKNFRDLGGYPTASGKVTKWKILYRSGDLSHLNADDWKKLTSLGVSTLIDLRSEMERDSASVSPDCPFHYHAVSLMNAFDAARDDPSDAASREFLKSMKLDYTEILFTNLPGMVGILNIILDTLASKKGSIAFFCTAGKDRTGITAALLLTLCGVFREDIIADYMVSANYNGWGTVDHFKASLPPEMTAMLPDSDADLLPLFQSDPGTISELLDAFESKDIRKCLAENGFTEEKQEKLVTLMTE